MKSAAAVTVATSTIMIMAIVGIILGDGNEERFLLVLLTAPLLTLAALASALTAQEEKIVRRSSRPND
jgi:hypothetical protein